jgi:hypothetical protein
MTSQYISWRPYAHGQAEETLRWFVYFSVFNLGFVVLGSQRSGFPVENAKTVVQKRWPGKIGLYFVRGSKSVDTAVAVSIFSSGGGLNQIPKSIANSVDVAGQS